MKQIIKVGMADLKVTKPPEALSTLGLGSCIGICIWDPSTKIAGLAHIMLPSSVNIRNNTNRAKFADTALVDMVEKMVSLGASKRKLVAKIAGGAKMFAFSTSNSTMNIGERNAESVREILKNMGIPIKADDTGGNFGRTIEFYPEDGKLFIKTIGHGEKTI